MSQLPMFGQPDEATEAPEDVTEMLPVFDYGYFDALVAVGFAALADAYFDTEGSPLIERDPTGFSVSYTQEPRENLDLGWLRYSLAADWKEKDWFENGWTLVKDADAITEKREGARRSHEALIHAEGALIDTSDDSTVDIKVGGETYGIAEPRRKLVAAINKLADATWFNLCVYLCRHQGRALLRDEFEESKVTFNSAVLPQASKGANSSNSYSIGNSSLSKTVSRNLSRSTCLAVAGLVRVAIGDLGQGFAIPVPRRIRLQHLTMIAKENRRRFVNGGFFFPFDNYLSFLKLLLTYTEIEDGPDPGEPILLSSVAGASFVELGNAPSPSGTWQLTVPNHEYSISSVERLQTLLYRWKKAKTAKPGRDPSVDRAAVRQLVRGFERSDPLDAAEGYLAYVFDVGLRRKENNQDVTYTALPQPFFKEIMSHTHSDLLRECQSDEVRRFIDLVRRETYNTIYPSEEQRAVNYHEKVQPNYAMMRKLREVQDTDDFTETITEIAVERGTKRIAMEKGDSEEKEFLAMPYEPSISKLVELAEKHDARLVAQVILSLALCRRPYDGDGNGDNEDDAETKETEEATSAKA